MKNQLNLGDISKRYTPDDQLNDTLSRLFRQVFRAQGLNTAEMTILINEYLDWEITEENPEIAKTKRQTLLGNIKSTLFNNDTLTFPKLLVGLSLLQAEECTFSLEVKFLNGETQKVSETCKIHNPKNSK